MTDTIIHIVLLIMLPPLLPGVINKTKAWFAGRNGPPVLQLYYDLIKLMRKGMVISATTSPREMPVSSVSTPGAAKLAP